MLAQRFAAFLLTTAIHVFLALMVLLVPTTGPIVPGNRERMALFNIALPSSPPAEPETAQPAAARPKAAAAKRASSPAPLPLMPVPMRPLAAIAAVPGDVPGEPALSAMPLSSSVTNQSKASAVTTTAERPREIAARPEPDPYAAMVHHWIEQRKSYPARYAARGIEGTVILVFELDRRGRLLALRVAGSSGMQELDQLARAQVNAAAPFPRAPRDASWQSRMFTVPMRYRAVS